MDEEKRDKSKCTGAVALGICIVVLLPVLYVLSIGPVFWVLTKLDVDPSGGAGKAYEVFYFPLLWLYDTTEGTSLGFLFDLLDSYLDLFV